MSEDKLRNLLEDYEQIDKVKQDLVRRISKEAKDIWVRKKHMHFSAVEITRNGNGVIFADIYGYNRKHDSEFHLKISKDKCSEEEDLLLRVLAVEGVNLV